MKKPSFWCSACNNMDEACPACHGQGLKARQELVRKVKRGLKGETKREPRFEEGQEVTVVETTRVAVGMQNAFHLLLEPDEHIGVVRSPNTNPVMARHDEPLVLVSFEMTGIGPMKTELYTRLGEDMLKPVDAETLENPLYRELQVPCKRCDGTGKSDNGLVACTICLGDGVVPNSILV